MRRGVYPNKSFTIVYWLPSFSFLQHLISFAAVCFFFFVSPNFTSVFFLFVFITFYFPPHPNTELGFNRSRIHSSMSKLFRKIEIEGFPNKAFPPLASKNSNLL